ncbi:MAG: rhodanese-like domain-containing protein [Clostridia bacterium]|nr:rhodanese-like domain-containing protein [Clostridia bacterium]MBT7123364.1 rhodanese-like domain-containing protein [Clostridia bacterium]
MMSADKNAVLIDVREKDEYRYGHIAGSANIPVGGITQSKSKLPSDKETAIIAYCLSGMRSRTACKMLGDLGYINLYNLGGINSWPYGIVK